MLGDWLPGLARTPLAELDLSGARFAFASRPLDLRLAGLGTLLGDEAVRLEAGLGLFGGTRGDSLPIPEPARRALGLAGGSASLRGSFEGGLELLLAEAQPPSSFVLEASLTPELPAHLRGLPLERVILTARGEGAGISVGLAAVLRLGSQEVELAVALDDQETVTLSAHLGRVTLGEAASLLSRGGTNPLAGAGLDEALELVDVTLALTPGDPTRIELTATGRVGSAEAELLIAASLAGDDVRPLLALRRRGLRLSELLGTQVGEALDLEFPDGLFSYQPRANGHGAAGAPGGGAAEPQGGGAGDPFRWGPMAQGFFASLGGTEDAGEPGGAADPAGPAGPGASGPSGTAAAPGFHFAGAIPALQLPEALRSALSLKDPNARLVFRGPLGEGPLFGEGAAQPSLPAFELSALLPEGGAPAWLPEGLPAWLRPAADSAPGLVLRYAPSAGVSALLTCEVEAELGGAARRFRLATELGASGGAARGALTGRATTPWKAPFGVAWLTLEDVELTVHAEGGAVETRRSSTLVVGSKRADLALELDTSGSATFAARLAELTLGDLAAFLAARLGSDPFGGLGLDAACSLTDATLTIRPGDPTRIELAAGAAAWGVSVDLLAQVELPRAGEPQASLALHRRAARLGDLLPAVRGSPFDLELPDGIFALNPGAPAGGRTVPSDDLGPAAREFYGRVHGPGPFELLVEPGVRFSAAVPVAALPSEVREALRIAASGEALVLEGSLGARLGLGGGSPLAALQELELSARLPATELPVLPAGLPAWMRPAAQGRRALSLSWRAPAELSFGVVNDVEADFGDGPRRFRVETAVASRGGAAQASFSGRMVGEWRDPFGLRGLALSDLTLRAALAGGAEQGSAAIVLEGGFELGAQRGSASIELGTAAEGKGKYQRPGRPSGRFTGRLERLALSELDALSLFPELPADGLATLNALLGRLPELRDVELAFTLGDEASLGLSATTTLRDVETELLVFVASGPTRSEGGGGQGGAGAPARTGGSSAPSGRGQGVVAALPRGLSLGRLLPQLGSNPALRDVAGLELDDFGLIAAHGDVVLSPSVLPARLRAFFERLQGSGDVSLSSGLNLLALVPTAGLAADGAFRQAMGIVGPALGIATDHLPLRGTLGRRPQDLRLTAALPPLRPPRRPAWLVEGRLGVFLSGAPALGLDGRITVDIEGDRLTFVLQTALERQGALPAIKLRGAL